MFSMPIFFVVLSLFVAAPQFAPGNRLQLPPDYRQWVWLSSGLGMNYGPIGAHEENPSFDNVFVNPASYRAFLDTGTWPEGTMFILENRASASKGSINTGGHYQSDLVAIEAEVKDSKRFPGKWAFFGFGNSGTSAAQIPTTASCYACHAKNGAVDNTFVQFYPTLIGVAKQKGTFRGD